MQSTAKTWSTSGENWVLNNHKIEQEPRQGSRGSSFEKRGAETGEVYTIEKGVKQGVYINHEKERAMELSSLFRYNIHYLYG